MSSKQPSSSNPRRRKQKENPVQQPPVQQPTFQRDPAYYYPQMVNPQTPYYYPQTPQAPQSSQSPYYPRPYYNPQNQPPPNVWQMRQQSSSESDFQAFFDSQSQSVPESVPETQYPSGSVPLEMPNIEPNESENVPKKTGKAPAIPWKEPEERDLGRAYVDVSEDPIIGNDQKEARFWNRVSQKFLARRGQGAYRKKDAIATKCRNMNRFAQQFNGIYMNTLRDWGSGRNDTDIVNKALELYADEHGRKFMYQGFWEEVRNCSKWQLANDSETYTGGSKRSKHGDNVYTTSGSEAHFGIDLNDDDDDEDEAEANEEAVEVEVRGRKKKPGRDKAKASQRGVSHNVRGSSSDSLKSMSTAISGLKSHLDVFKDIAYEKQKSRDMKLLMKNISGLTGAEYETAMQVKENIKKKYNM